MQKYDYKIFCMKTYNQNLFVIYIKLKHEPILRKFDAMQHYNHIDHLIYLLFKIVKRYIRVISLKI